MIEDAESQDDLDAFVAAVEAELERLFGPHHQEILSTSGREIDAFTW